MAKTDDAQQLLTEAEQQKDESSSRQNSKRSIKDVDDAAEKPAKRGRGRPPIPEHLRKTKPYVPSGKPRGRPKLPEHLKKKNTAAKPASASGSGRGRGRPPKKDVASAAPATPKGKPGRPKKTQKTPE